MTLATVGTMAATNLYGFYEAVTNNYVGKAVKQYGFAETVFTTTAIFAGLKTAQVAVQNARTAWKEENKVHAAAWGALAATSLFLAGWEGCRATRNAFGTGTEASAQAAAPEASVASTEL